MKRYLKSVATSSLALSALAGCVAAEARDEAATSATAQAATVIGDPLPGTDLAAFEAAKDNFSEAETIEDGIGPVFNELACGNCHTTPVIGGSGTQIERRFGRVSGGVFYGYDQAGNDQGGTLRQLFSNGTYVGPSGATCTIPLEKEPADATVHNVGRRTLPLFGLGLIDAMPDSFFDLLAANEPAATRGTVIRSKPQFPDDRDPNQGVDKLRVNRFGIKNQQTNLVSFSGDAYINEMGVSTQSCYKGTSIKAFAFDNQANNVHPAPGCGDGDLAPEQVETSEVPRYTDDAVGTCAGGRSEVQGDLLNFRIFMERLAPPPQDISDPFTFTYGLAKFDDAGCSDCHSIGPFITPDKPWNGVPGGMAFFPFSDFLVHDMGSLGDGIGDTGDSVATTRQMRTAPLWGARFNTQFLHDGRAKSVRAAILAHDGQGLAARNEFAAMNFIDQTLLIKFVNSI